MEKTNINNYVGMWFKYSRFDSSEAFYINTQTVIIAETGTTIFVHLVSDFNFHDVSEETLLDNWEVINNSYPDNRKPIRK